MDGLVPRGFNLAALILIGGEARRMQGALLQSTQSPQQAFKGVQKESRGSNLQAYSGQVDTCVHAETLKNN